VKSITATVASVSNNIVTLTANVGLDHTFAVGTRVFRARIPASGTNALQVNGNSTGTTVTVDAVGGDYSRTAILAVNRPHEKVTVAAVTNLDQIPVTLANLRPTGTKVGLWSFDETRTITAVDRDLNELTFNSALLYSHRRTARVRKAKQDWLVMNTNQAAVEGKVVLGDTIAIDTLTAGLAEANADRIYATVSGIDSERDRIRITIDKAGVAIGPSASFTLMGDAAAVATVPDANGNALQGYLNRFNLNDGTIR